MNTQSHLRVRALTEGAVLVALAQILSFFPKLYELPQGGSITLEMLPIFFYCIRWGFAPGMVASVAFSILQFIFSSHAWSWQSIFGDYLIAFSALGLCGLFRNVPFGVYIGTIVGSLGRFLSHFIVGATFWKIYMPDEFFGMTMTSPWFYSFLYNGSFMAIDLVLCLLVFAILSRTPLRRYLAGDDLRLPMKTDRNSA